MLQVNHELAQAVYKLFEDEKLVCSPTLRKRLFTVGALDNIDHNPSATTATGSFHGTGISIFQFPTVDKPGVARAPLVLDSSSNPSLKYSLPDNYINVPAVSCKPDKLTVSKFVEPNTITSVLEEGKESEGKWIRH